MLDETGVVPWRTESWVARLGRLGRMGRIGALQSRVSIWDLSSKQSTLFAALDVATGKVTATRQPRHCGASSFLAGGSIAETV